jgi:anaerobic selenocysteine-containing dehydrogenase
MSLNDLNQRVSAARKDIEERGETFYPGASRIHLAAYPPKERWNDWVELDSKAWPKRVEKRYMLVPTTCFNCESACGLLAYVDKETLQVRKFEGNPEHPGSRGRNCAKGPATVNQVTDPDRILYPLKRVGERGEGKWERCSWDEVLDLLAERIRAILQEKRHNEFLYHVGRPGEDGFTERMIAHWGVDGHNSHTNVCSSGARTGYHFWMGMDRPSPDHENARVILLVSSHLESGHYFNPHAQRIIEGKKNGAKLVVLDTRLSNTATHADHWLSPHPGSEAAIFLAIANHLIQNDLYNRDYVRKWWNWQEYLEAKHPDEPATFENFESKLKGVYVDYTFEFASRESGVDTGTLQAVADLVSRAGTQLATHNWRSAAAANLGGWQVSRTLFMLNALTGSIATPGGTFPNAYNKFVPRPIHLPNHPRVWNHMSWPEEYPLSMMELSYLLPHLVREGRGRFDTYISRVYNPVWTNPDGFTWIEMLADPEQVGLHVALTPTWSETAFFADYILPMGHSSERHDTISYEQYDGQFVSFRQPVLRAARERMGEEIHDTRDVNPGEVWEENEFWIDLTWRIDPHGELGIRDFFESKKNPGMKLSVDEYYGWMFENSMPGLPEKAAAEGLTPLQYMRRYGAFEVRKKVGQLYAQPVPQEEMAEDARIDRLGRAYTRTAKPADPNVVPFPPMEGDDEGRRRVGIEVDGTVVKGFPTPSGRLEFWSRTLHDWGWPELAMPTYIKSHVHRQNMDDDQMVLVSTFRLPVQIHTRSANAKWLDEIAHTNPLWIHPEDGRKMGGVKTGDLVRVETEIGYFVVKAWVTEGIRPGCVACSHHMGRWKLNDGNEGGVGQRISMATVALDQDGTEWGMKRKNGTGPFDSDDPDTKRIWWTDVGVHQNLTHAVHPDPISGMHCWHQAVRVKKAQAGDRYGDIWVDTEKSHQVYRDWLEKTRAARDVSPDGTRRPYWLLRPVRPEKEAYRLPGQGAGGGGAPAAPGPDAPAPTPDPEPAGAGD